MRAAIAAAVVGDEQMREDPTVNELQERVAALLGQERALFLPTATMANQIALKLHGRPGDVLVAERALARPGLRVRRRGRARRAPHRRAAGHRRAGSRRRRCGPRPRPSRTWSTSVPPCSCSRTPTTSPAAASGRSTSSTRSWRPPAPAGVGVHLDGARLMNAAVALGVPAAAIGSRVDTVTLCLSKGLGCPLGAAARRPRRPDGGGLAAEVPLRRRDAAGRDRSPPPRCTPSTTTSSGSPSTTSGPAGSPRVGTPTGIPVELDRVETNFVQIDTSRLDLSRAEVLAALRDAGVALSPTYGRLAHPRGHAPRSRRRRHRARARARAGGTGGRMPSPEQGHRGRARPPAGDGAGRAAHAVGVGVRVPRRRDPLGARARGRRRRDVARGDRATTSTGSARSRRRSRPFSSCSSWLRAGSSSRRRFAPTFPRLRWSRRCGWRSVT